jgi:hypothetical protein
MKRGNEGRFWYNCGKLKNEKPLMKMILWSMHGYEISLLELRLAQFQKEKESFMNDLLKNDKE